MVLLCLSTFLPGCHRAPRTLPAGAWGAPTVTVPLGMPGACSLAGVAPELIVVPDAAPSEWHGRFDLPDYPRFWQPAAGDPAIAQFRDSVRARLGAEPEARALIERQRKIFAAMPGDWSGEANNATLLLAGDAGRVAPISCLEAMLWKWQAARFPMLAHPTEFGALILRRSGEVRVYLSSADLVGQRFRSTIADHVRRDLADGFRLVAHLHNHPFLFDRVVGDRMWTVDGTVRDVAGALAPSMADVQFYRSLRGSLGLAEGWVTNGMQSAHFGAREFDLLTGR